ncbi:unnamed protein product [Orchesella dallaii]|uniref:Uncharacterized protein n=1 Tax=Orchesella dallaii TaxID=48710 RepID=A0ABP1Q3D7_9HEXA
MATSEKPALARTNSTNELANVYGHDTKKYRLRAVSAEKDVYSKFISKPLAKKLSWAQLFLVALISSAQVTTMGLSVGRYSYDDTASMGAGIWSSFIVLVAALETLWCLRSAKYWKLHLSFALHIISVLGTIVLLISEFGGNIPHLRWKIGEAMYEDDEDYDRYNDRGYYSYEPVTLENGTIVHRDMFHKYNSYHHSNDANRAKSLPMLFTSLVLNSVMAVSGLAQLVISFVMTLMTGRAICCSQTKMNGKLFELEIAGSENADAVGVFRKALNNSHRMNSIHLQDGSVADGSTKKDVSLSPTTAPPSYCDTFTGAQLI